MATPLNPFQHPQERTEPNAVQAVKRVDLALVTFTDEYNVQHSTMAIVGDKHVHFLEGRALGFSKNTTPSGRANAKMAQTIFDSLDGVKSADDILPTPPTVKHKRGKK